MYRIIYQSQRFFKFNLLFYQNIGSNWRGPELRLWECRHAFVHRFTGLISVFRWHSYECLSAVRPIAIQCLDNIIRILSVELSNFSGVLILGLGLFMSSKGVSTNIVKFVTFKNFNEFDDKAFSISRYFRKLLQHLQARWSMKEYLKIISPGYSSIVN